MFVRVKKKGNSLAFSVVSSQRVDGKVKQITHLSLGAIVPPCSQIDYRENHHDFVKFWRIAHTRALGWDQREWPAIHNGIERYLPYQLHYDIFMEDVRKENIVRTLQAKKGEKTG